VIWSLLCITNVFAVFIGKKKVILSLPHSQNERQRSVTDIKLFILRNICGN